MGRGVTIQTDYLIRGEDPTVVDPNENAIKKLEEEAKAKGVRR